MAYIPRYRGLGADPALVSSISSAIARMENVNPSYHNPGGLIAAPGCISRPGQIAICPDDATGEAGLERQVGIDIDRGWTLNQLINSWAPVCSDPICQGNNPTAYANNVATWTNLPQDVPLSTLNTDASAAVAASDVSAPFDLSSITADLSSMDSTGWMWVAGAVGLAILAYVVLD